MRWDGVDLFRKEVTAECDSAKGSEHGTPAGKEDPASGDDRVAHKRPSFLSGEFGGRRTAMMNSPRVRRRVHREQKITAPARQALPGLNDVACAVACVLRDQLPSA